jgi:hypothetical protein
MIERAFAEEFAADWIDAWNDDDEERLFYHFSGDFQAWAPALALISGDGTLTLRGRSAVIEAWAHGRYRLADVRFALTSVLVGETNVTVYYQGIRRRLAAETFYFDADLRVAWAVTMLGEPLAAWPFAASARYSRNQPQRDREGFRACA